MSRKRSLMDRLRLEAVKFVMAHKSTDGGFKLSPEMEIDYVHAAMMIGATVAIERAESIREPKKLAA